MKNIYNYKTFVCPDTGNLCLFSWSVCVVTHSAVSNTLWPNELEPTGSPVHGTSQARILEWAAISFSKGSSWPRGRTHLSCVSCITDRFFTHSAIREDLFSLARGLSILLMFFKDLGFNPFIFLLFFDFLLHYSAFSFIIPMCLFALSWISSF